MTLVSNYVTFRGVFMDKGGNKVPMIFKSTATTPAGAALIHAELLSILPGLTTARLIELTYTLGVAENDLTPVSTLGEVENRAVISCLLVQESSGPGQTRYGDISIPAPIEGMFQATAGPLNNVVNPNHAGLQSLLALYETGWGILGALTLSDYQGIADPTAAGNVKGKREHKKNRKG